MTNTVRSEKRRAKDRRKQKGKIMTKCEVCGREGPRRSMIHRGERWVCRRIPQCMERTFLRINRPPQTVPLRTPRRDRVWDMTDRVWRLNPFREKLEISSD